MTAENANPAPEIIWGLRATGDGALVPPKLSRDVTTLPIPTEIDTGLPNGRMLGIGERRYEQTSKLT